MSNSRSILLPGQESPLKSSRRKALAAFLSVFLPGGGHFLIKRYGIGIVLLLIFCALFFICWPLRMLVHVAASIGFALGVLALCITSVVDCAYGRAHRRIRPSQWWLVLLLPLAFGAARIHVTWMMRQAGFQSFEVPSRSMENTVPMGAHVMVDRWYYRGHACARGEIVIYQNKEGFYLIKRVIARGGETIRSTDGVIFVNDELMPEPYVIHTGHAEPDLNNFGPVTIPEGKLFVMGDNRDISLDSRSSEVGLVDASSLRARPLYTLPVFRNGDYKQLQ